MNNFDTIKTITKSIAYNSEDLVTAKKLPTDIVIGLLLRTIVDERYHVSFQEKPTKAICINSLRLYSNGMLYSLHTCSTVAQLNAKTLEYIEKVAQERVERDRNNLKSKLTNMQNQVVTNCCVK
ncbi:MAG: hypothetical protein IKZ34_01105 [Alphaproteobacteria bacterium]|jgi:G:T-mismatch repair DNA endonuclease (very short patch repair protein)|nr:hypothetical protein [Alphaproteobacteria bacterium]